MQPVKNDIPNNHFFDFEIFMLNEEFPGKITGENQRKILVVTQPAPTKAEMLFLEKVLTAVKVDVVKDIALAVAEEKQTFNLFDVLRKLPTERVLIFGLTPPQCGLNLNLTKYQPLVHSGVQILLCNQLAEIENNQQLKRHLWSALQQIFPDNGA